MAGRRLARCQACRQQFGQDLPCLSL